MEGMYEKLCKKDGAARRRFSAIREKTDSWSKSLLTRAKVKQYVLNKLSFSCLKHLVIIILIDRFRAFCVHGSRSSCHF